jgi:hypothetical protein
MRAILPKIKWWHIVIGIVLLCLVPFPSRMVPEWTMTVVDDDGSHLVGIQVEESWKHYTYFSAEGFELRRSDENGVVRFPPRFLWASALSRLFSPPLAELGKLAHGSAGLSINARVWDPEKKYSSGSENMIFWYSDWQAGKPLPSKIVGTYQSDWNP